MTDPRLMVIQFGDYRSGLEARAKGFPETYRAQRYSLDVMDQALGDGTGLVLCLDTDSHDVVYGKWHVVGDRFMPTGRSLQYQLRARRSASRMRAIADAFKPTHLIIRTPGWVLASMGAWALKHDVQLLPILADYFRADSFLERLRLRPVLKVLRNPRVKVVSNHNVPASRTLSEAGVEPKKIVPWDWPPTSHPEDAAPRRRSSSRLGLVYAGTISTDKGVGDLLEALALLPEDGQKGSRDVVGALHVFGDGPERAEFTRRAESLGLGRIVIFHGIQPNSIVRNAMGKNDIVMVPSRASYPEGLPNVIYEAFETRTPLLCSDHPAFRGRLHDGLGCRLFPPGDAHALANVLQEASIPETYDTLSETTLDAWKAIAFPVLFGDIVKGWLRWTVSGEKPAFMAHALEPQDKNSTAHPNPPARPFQSDLPKNSDIEEA